MLRVDGAGLYCEAGAFYIDPSKPVERAVLTHAHADHARPGSRLYVTTREGEALVRARLGPESDIRALTYGEALQCGPVRLSLHPAGHIRGSAQVRLEYRGEVWVVSGDYKLAADPSCAPFEALRCHTFVTESTFGLPVFRWPRAGEVMEDIHAWWKGNRESGKTSLLFVYPLGKAQRVLAGLDLSIGPLYAHGSVRRFTEIYRSAGVKLPVCASQPGPGALVLAPPSAVGSPWARRFGPTSTALASGWMRIRGARRRRSLDRGFALSDHADWPALNDAVAATGAERIWVTGGHRAPLAEWLREKGYHAEAVELPVEDAGEHA